MSELQKLPLAEAIRLRWVMRDIRARRFVTSPLHAADVQALTEMGYVETRDGFPALTAAALNEI
ncbi:hypothetical protein ACVIHI_008970 [Bradyrhizobium sp. USDA 4524]|uniref:hypothetical protein n=1 Tax=unclassified Bradyrhizobium TaxID=2631580 RepID=UPI00209F821E|nr:MULTISPECIES: hypothetical protein [unclassified Bradyrhizobium]MCP1845563.1 hypothetical protein [Bradyrhizobium sp. USDA 4538]MCP1907115.1 hypothetical protein [Bradyrhizobium sp. USDA 4537]MCP1985590.1 hypothetical protein [Bradyrhizobium sp. USDA 4539]